MKDLFRRILALLGVAALALALTLLISSGDGARAMLQASPLDSPLDPFDPALTPTDDPFAPPDIDFPTLEAPTLAPPPVVVGTPTPRGFLPAPTIVNPNDLDSLSLAQPPAPRVWPQPEPTPLPAAAPANASLAAVVTLLNYLWLVCGGILLIGGAVAILLVWRRGQQS